MAKLEAGGRRDLSELRLHNGTIYRWNRPIYDIVGGKPAPAGGEPRPARRPDHRRRPRERGLLLRRHPDARAEDRPVWTKMSFAACAEQNFHAGPRRHRVAALLARLRRAVGRRAGAARTCSRWPTRGCASGGLRRRARPLPRGHRGPLQDRASTAPTWPTRVVQAVRGPGPGPPRGAAPDARAYAVHMHTNEPVHTWPLP